MISLRERWRIPNYADPQEVRHGVVEVDPEECNACTLCEKYCPADALVVKEKTLRMKSSDENNCMFCGACVVVCPRDAIKMVAGHEFEGYFKTIGHGKPSPPRLQEDW